ncbi:hypothetical protein F4861DRAFT_551789 [Xylaria intraflava]|nr:hypothetical protein F4861DRAFT_551789 [Xylaria intraflava]
MANIPKIEQIIEADNDNHGFLTCGIEMEFLVPSIFKLDADPDPDIKDQLLFTSRRYDKNLVDKDIRNQLLETLRQLDMPFRSIDDDYFHPPHGRVVVYDSWRLGSDSTVRKNKDEDGNNPVPGPYKWTACELTSMVMGHDDYAPKIEEVCRVLKSIRIHLNKSTSIHIHIGLGDKPFSLITVKKFVTLYWFLERAVFELHHPSRRNNKYSFLLTKYSNLGAKKPAVLNREFGPIGKEGVELMELYVPHIKSNKLRGQIRRIWGCSNVQSIAKLMGRAQDIIGEDLANGERGSIGFRRFLPAWGVGEVVGGNIQTFEWRQMSGSLDAKLINSWIEFCLIFTDYCRLAPPLDFRNAMGEVLEGYRKCDGVTLLVSFGLDITIFEDMAEKWVEDPDFCDDDQGMDLFVPKS